MAKVDFWQLSRDGADRVVALIADRTRKAGGKLLVVDADAGRRAAIGRTLWEGAPEAFLANGAADESHAERQPILLSGECAAVNGARLVVLADGQWREDALGVERTIFLFGDETLDAARAVWRELGERDGLERSYFAQEDGKWVKKV